MEILELKSGVFGTISPNERTVPVYAFPFLVMTGMGREKELVNKILFLARIISCLGRNDTGDINRTITNMWNKLSKHDRSILAKQESIWHYTVLSQENISIKQVVSEGSEKNIERTNPYVLTVKDGNFYLSQLPDYTEQKEGKKVKAWYVTRDREIFMYDCDTATLTRHNRVFYPKKDIFSFLTKNSPLIFFTNQKRLNSMLSTMLFEVQDDKLFMLAMELLSTHDPDKETIYLHIDEPATHQHPYVDITIANVLSLLVNKGLYVSVTTHSIDILFYLNNLYVAGQLYRTSREKAHGFQPWDESSAMQNTKRKALPLSRKHVILFVDGKRLSTWGQGWDNSHATSAPRFLS